MWESGLLHTLRWTPVAAEGGSMRGLCQTRWSNPVNIKFKKHLESGKNIFSCSGKYCECRYLRRETAPAEVAARLGRTWWRDVPLRLRTQSCCDLLLGRLNRTADDGSLLETGTG